MKQEKPNPHRWTRRDVVAFLGMGVANVLMFDEQSFGRGSVKNESMVSVLNDLPDQFNVVKRATNRAFLVQASTLALIVNGAVQAFRKRV